MKKLLMVILLCLVAMPLCGQDIDISAWDLSPVAISDSGFLILVRINPSVEDVAYQGFYTRGDSIKISVATFVHVRTRDGCFFGQPKHYADSPKMVYNPVPCNLYGQLEQLYRKVLARTRTVPLEELPK